MLNKYIKRKRVRAALAIETHFLARIPEVLLKLYDIFTFNRIGGTKNILLCSVRFYVLVCTSFLNSVA